MSSQFPQRSDEDTVLMQQEVARQQIAAEQAEENARFLAAQNTVLRNRVAEGSQSMWPMLGVLMAVGAIVALFLFMSASTNDTRQQAEATRQEATATRMEAAAANNRANSALDAAYRSGQRSQAASATAQQAAGAAMRAEQNTQQPTVIVNPPPPPAVIVTPSEPVQSVPVTEIPSTTTEIPSNSDQKPLEGRIE